MTRNTAREIAVHLAYELSFSDLPVEEFLDQQLSAETFSELAPEDSLYEELSQKYLDAGYQEVIDERQAALDAGNTTRLQ